jgi:hypothetical protein
MLSLLFGHGWFQTPLIFPPNSVVDLETCRPSPRIEKENVTKIRKSIARCTTSPMARPIKQ